MVSSSVLVLLEGNEKKEVLKQYYVVTHKGTPVVRDNTISLLIRKWHSLGSLANDYLFGGGDHDVIRGEEGNDEIGRKWK